MGQPKQLDTPLYALLHKDDIKGFNQQRSKGAPLDMRGGDFRGLDLRELDASGLDLRDAYFRSADLRGIDFRNCQLEGASFCQAHISGCFFPKEISADEIRLSFDIGIRVNATSRSSR